jgi:hypothetical protein
MDKSAEETNNPEMPLALSDLDRRIIATVREPLLSLNIMAQLLQYFN